MSARARAAQHKPARETKAKELAEAKQIIRQLKREVSRLRRRVSELEEQASIPDSILHPEEPETLKIESEEKDDVARCDSCGSVNIRTFNTPSSVFVGCADCKWRKTTPKPDAL